MEEPYENNDINYIILLEAYKRFKEDECNIRPFVEEKIRQYNEVKNEYLGLYYRYVEAATSSICREALQSDNFEVVQNIDKTDRSIKTISRETLIDKQDDFITTDVIAQTKELVAKAPNFDHLVDLNISAQNNKNRVDFLESSLARVQSKLENSIVSGFDSLLKRIEN